MLADWYRQQRRKEALEKGREEGRAEVREIWLEWLRNWEAWDQRRTDARREGKEVTEPRPLAPDET